MSKKAIPKKKGLVVKVGDRVCYQGQQAIVTQVKGGHHAHIHFGVTDGRSFDAYVKLDDLSPGAEVVTAEEIAKRDPHLLAGQAG